MLRRRSCPIFTTSPPSVRALPVAAKGNRGSHPRENTTNPGARHRQYHPLWQGTHQASEKPLGLHRHRAMSGANPASIPAGDTVMKQRGARRSRAPNSRSALVTGIICNRLFRPSSTLCMCLCTVGVISTKGALPEDSVVCLQLACGLGTAGPQGAQHAVASARRNSTRASTTAVTWAVVWHCVCSSSGGIGEFVGCALDCGANNKRARSRTAMDIWLESHLCGGRRHREGTCNTQAGACQSYCTQYGTSL